MQAGEPQILPPRDSVQSEPRRSGLSRRGERTIIVAMLAVALFVAVAIVLGLPRPDVVIQSPSYTLSGCDVIATFHLVNQGNADGYVTVHLLSDGTSIGSQTVVVPPGGAVPGTITAGSPGCSPHTYSLYLSYESSGL